MYARILVNTKYLKSSMPIEDYQPLNKITTCVFVFVIIQMTKDLYTGVWAHIDVRPLHISSNV